MHSQSNFGGLFLTCKSLSLANVNFECGFMSICTQVILCDACFLHLVMCCFEIILSLSNFGEEEF